MDCLTAEVRQRQRPLHPFHCHCQDNVVMVALDPTTTVLGPYLIVAVEGYEFPNAHELHPGYVINAKSLHDMAHVHGLMSWMFPRSVISDGFGRPPNHQAELNAI